MSARTEILQRIRNAVGPSPTVESVARDYLQSADPTGTAKLIDLLVDRLLDYRAIVERVDDGSVRDAVRRSVQGRSGPLVVPPGLESAWIDGLEADGLITIVDDDLTAGVLDTAAGVLTAAAIAIAETGTIVLDASPDQGRRAISLVPDLHVCVLRADQVVLGVPEAISRLDPARPLTLISGPSATSDIELSRVEGVHGPRTLHVVIVGSATQAG